MDSGRENEMYLNRFSIRQVHCYMFFNLPLIYIKFLFSVLSCKCSALDFFSSARKCLCIACNGRQIFFSFCYMPCKDECR